MATRTGAAPTTTSVADMMQSRCHRAPRKDQPVQQLTLYVPDGKIAPPVNPYGRQVANAGVFRALAHHGGYERIHVQSRSPRDESELAAEFQVAEGDVQITNGPLLDATAPTAAGTLLYGQSYLSEPAWIRRRAAADDAYSIVGTLFAFASASHRERMVESVLAPLQPWDAIVCSSPTLATTIGGVFDRWEEHLRERLGSAVELPRPQLPVIGFGCDVDALAARGDDASARADLRSRLGVGDDEAVVFHLGRLSYYDKAYPQAMFQAVAEARRTTGTGIHFVLAGWFPNGEADRTLYEDAAAHYAPGVTTHFLDGNDQELVSQCWAAADIFLLLSDTILETFGQAVVEAMAAGLPVVVSDWDGYRFIVSDGVDGFLVPTLGAAPGALGETLSLLQYVDELPYPSYVGAVAAHTAVNVERAAHALSELVASPALRGQIGAAARRSVRARFDWPVVAQAYVELFDELASLREAAPPVDVGQRLNPLRGDPFADFAALPAQRIADDLVISATGRPIPGGDVPLDATFPGLRGSAAEAEAVLAALSGGPLSVGEVLGGFPLTRRPFVRNTIMWLAKSGVVDWAHSPNSGPRAE